MTAPPGPEQAGTGTSFGIDIGGTKVLGVALEQSGDVVAEARVATPRPPAAPPGAVGRPGRRRIGAEVADAVADVVGALRAATGWRAPGVPVGVGAPGLVDRDGVLRVAPNLSGSAGADLPDLLTDRLPGAPVVVANDANLAGVAEHALGAARGEDTALLVTLGTGIGGAVIAGGRVVTGARGFAGEVGHMLVVPHGLPCACGRRGCWEQYASGDRLGRLARDAAGAGSLDAVVALAGGEPGDVRGEHVTRAALAGDGRAVQVLAELGWWIAFGLANLAAVLDPSRIVIGGGLAEAGGLLVDPVRRAFAELLYAGPDRPPIAIVPADLGERAGAIGAALVARGVR